MQTAADELRELQHDLDDVEQLRRQLAQYFCEDEATFKLDDCIKTFRTFFDSFLKAIEVSRHMVFCSMCVLEIDQLILQNIVIALYFVRYYSFISAITDREKPRIMLLF